MLFKKRKKIIDLTELQRRGIIRPPKKEKEIKTDKQGFVDLSQNSTSSASSFSDPFLFAENPTTQNNDDFYKKREVDRKIEELDNKIYKLEQRIELLERKVGVGNYSSY
ncbi:MAG: hypothetical protein QXX68_00485 [Candidatus Pacearchaeota archaeon]